MSLLLSQGNNLRRERLTSPLGLGEFATGASHRITTVAVKFLKICNFLRAVEGLAAARSSGRRRPPFVLRTFPPPGGITLGGSDDALCRHSLPPRSPAPTKTSFLICLNLQYLTAGASRPPYDDSRWVLGEFATGGANPSPTTIQLYFSVSDSLPLSSLIPAAVGRRPQNRPINPS